MLVGEIFKKEGHERYDIKFHVFSSLDLWENEQAIILVLELMFSW